MESVTRAGIFQRVEPNGAAAAAERLMPAEFWLGKSSSPKANPAIGFM